MVSRGPAGFRELREACWNHVHILVPLRLRSAEFWQKKICFDNLDILVFVICSPLGDGNWRCSTEKMDSMQKTTPIGDRRTPGIEDLTAYAQILIVVSFSVFVWNMLSVKNTG